MYHQEYTFSTILKNIFLYNIILPELSSLSKNGDTKQLRYTWMEWIRPVNVEHQLKNVLSFSFIILSYD